MTYIYRKLTINYSKFHIKNYQPCFFYEDLANSRAYFALACKMGAETPSITEKIGLTLRAIFGHFDEKTPSAIS